MLSKRYMLVLLLLGMFLFSNACGVELLSCSSEQTGTLSGFVTDTFMNPLEGALVRVYFHETYEENYSDSSGYYHVTNIPLCYCLKNATCSKLGYKTEWILLSIGENTTYNFILSALNQTCYPVFNGTMGSGNWYISPVIVSFVINGDVDEVFYKVDSGEWNQYSEPFEIYDSGLHIFYWYYTYQGNVYPTQSLPLRIDCDIPELQLSSERININMVQITADANDETSGISKVEFYVEDDLWNVAYQPPYTCVVSGIGTHHVKAVAFDYAGNSVNSTIITSLQYQSFYQNILSFLLRIFFFLNPYIIFHS